MRNILRDYLTDVHDLQRVSIAIAKGTVARGIRSIDLKRPSTWEFSGFSQNGEDGIIDVLRSALQRPNRYFVEIGSADGVQNNTSWLLVSEQYHGLMVEGNAAMSTKARRLLSGCGIGVRFQPQFVTRENAGDLLTLCSDMQPDLFSLDIDGNDYYVADALLRRGLRPKIVVVEYNSVFGPKRSVTIPYTSTFDYRRAHPSQLYYGASLRAWHKLFTGLGYRFVTVDRNGVNAVFADPAHFRPQFLEDVVPLDYAENSYQVAASGKRGEEQYALIGGLELAEV
jgi:hypothetical protein